MTKENNTTPTHSPNPNSAPNPNETLPLLNRQIRKSKTTTEYKLGGNTNSITANPHRHAQYSSQSHAIPPPPPSGASVGPGGGPLIRPQITGPGGINTSEYTEFDDYVSTKRHYSFSANEYRQLERPLFHRLLTSHHSVTNPGSPFDNYINGNVSNPQINTPLFPQKTGGDRSSIGSITEGGIPSEYRRLSVVDIVGSLRPARLLGTVPPLCKWSNFFNSNIEKIKKKDVRKYYEEQNYLIERFTEIDNFLDAGKIHYNMLSNYGNEHANDSLENITEELGESSNSTTKGQPANNSVLATDLERADSNSKYSNRFNDVPGNVNDGSRYLGYNEEESNAQVLTAILVNFLINILLLIGKIVVTLLTSSMSVIASLVDSVLDFLSTFIIYIVNRLATKNDWKIQHAYPIGRSRLEPLGVLIFSIIIIISFFQVGQEAFKRLFFPAPGQKIPVAIGFDAIGIMTITIVAKLGCWVWCSSSKSSSVQALAQDAMTDVIFNTVSLLMPTLGHFFNIWWFDPLGAFLLSIYIIVNWGYTAFEHINNLTGAAADPLDYKVILYLAYRFAEPIKQITALKVYHVGDNLNVEVDLVFANDKFNLSFKDCHDIAEALQYSIESLPMVERAFVHIDYMEGNYKGHLK
ncbi:Metal tolerance protein 3 [Candida viswanathii]|uniref:Metal tolerance protein 3 n=1 Tax=Candida viswanathii TaxID=5486 RepID=A0A367Y0G8_9ASCO|nr:Metal tolerance protein 3 [Candida viswanathii]